MKHEQYLLCALEEAIKGRGFCSPNPSVGAVAVKNNEIIARDFHKGAGTAHAEVLVFKQFPKNTDNVTLYVSLEPCNHWGRTPPCVDAIVNHGVREVFYAYKDPNPVVKNNDTPTILEQHGIKSTFIQLNKIDEFYESYTHWRLTGKPFVTAKIAQTLDGKIAELNGKPCKISNEHCDEFTHNQRKSTDVILTSARTVNNDNPLLNARSDHDVHAKNIAIIDTHHSLNADARIFNTAKKIHIFCSNAPEQIIERENVSYHVVASDEHGLKLEDVITQLGTLGYHDVWVEAGARIFSQLHEANLVDRTYIYIAPNILGANALSNYTNNYFQGSKSVTWQMMGNNIMLRMDWR
ncbi:MAG: bifunctional diaminohydroxyphosphoribosylaminopyrimidine deaminase/5-amino-6-(5-phosphoribosylamino)uracil reductase RibD [Legionella sp.]|uniref:bifunctional diaminohydroxyphosphoribosylaminopyrimidine deaminase/5-amino-6-(5-phosphoribosylamino)uracil reductase RibD n=1 Tax=Legionella sp. TaxID=459 RepID=UPI002844E0B4|nr:bifunctional diaminohydroxyphosphoribosylaminopyrimidine deaminase/5-amino-6-(5-phosphoribosylamino)uracil reductase RibD [Legionella sp.]